GLGGAEAAVQGPVAGAVRDGQVVVEHAREVDADDEQEGQQRQQDGQLRGGGAPPRGAGAVCRAARPDECAFLQQAVRADACRRDRSRPTGRGGGHLRGGEQNRRRARGGGLTGGAGGREGTTDRSAEADGRVPAVNGLVRRNTRS